jgi:parallel beta-helix repeat protein
VVTATYASTAAIQRPEVTAHSIASTTDKLASAAAGPPSTAPETALESVAIGPSEPVVVIGSTTQLKATATFNDGSVKDVTAEFGWTSSDTRTMTANASGALAGLATGPAVISGSYQGRQASVPATSTIGEVEWSSPLVINQGGTYSGNWQSTDAKTPAVTVTTTEPVVIENSHIRSAGSLIKTSVAGTNLTVRNSLGVAANAAVKGQPNGVFLEVSSPARLDVENNYIENAQGGVIVHGYSGNREGEQNIVIRSNRARNMNGLLSDGNGSYLPGEGANQTQARFIQFDSVQSVPGIDVGWNEVVNYPGRSLAGDNIDVYRSGGTANQPLEIHDSYIQGAYPYKAAQDAYTGGGIKTDSKAGDSAQEVSAFNNIHDNQVVGTTSYGIQFAAGHDNTASNNRVISSGLLADGTKIAAQDVGLVNVGAASASMYNNAMRDNLVGWACWKSSCAQEGYRKDQYFPASTEDYSTNSVVPAGQITFEMENKEYQVWLNKLASVGIAVGPSF